MLEHPLMQTLLSMSLKNDSKYCEELKAPILNKLLLKQVNIVNLLNKELNNHQYGKRKAWRISTYELLQILTENLDKMNRKGFFTIKGRQSQTSCHSSTVHFILGHYSNRKIFFDYYVVGTYEKTFLKNLVQYEKVAENQLTLLIQEISPSKIATIGNVDENSK